ncbi:putative phage protein gp47/JayE [Lactobacillus colini]|uniref:Phage protein gp47/JayE n=1 Tax=Lactobacillus colini TaxID=1819254 RepID=A0ABS4MDZ5_9LACO|nr:putative phage protein gp47/JayE [Lactobacillus colini]
MALKFGITENGFVAPTYEEILDSVEDDFQSKFGSDIVLTSNSNLGIIARLIAWRETSMIQELQQVYYSAFISTATESALDRLGSNAGIPRKVASPSFAEIVITTEEEYLIQAGEQFETEDGIVFNLLTDVLTTKQKDGTWQGIGQVQSDETGDFNNVEANKITIISNPDDEVINVTNPAPATGGQETETDSTYRNRLILENSAKPGPTASGIKSALLNLPGVREVGIVENSENKVDEYGNPPYTVHIYVLGGKGQEIADTLSKHIAAGVTLTGSKNYTVVDDSGNKKGISFDFAQNKPIYVKVEISANAKWNTDSSSDEIKKAIAENINSLEMGQTVHLTKLYPAIYGIEGVEEASVTLGIDSNSLGSTDITCKKFEAPSCDEDNVEVVIK